MTRGVRRPFQVSDGLERLLDAYRAAGGASGVEAVHVHVHEIVIRALEWSDGGDANGRRDRMRSLLRRIGA